ncbi:hypothetical protein [Polyangium jinanense]|uniref:Uncharacterized protein n=1 Tax=Polyangium jinanense TaxID=2829994 RepID=A0A9X4ATC2_9BACT|nr:hypothetical protein [Polyangium jinanense]MDC3984083.1 hypothetical protein [Polyangium jinanense]
MESTLTWIFALVMASLALAVPIFLQRRADAKIRALSDDRSRILDRERELASRFLAEQKAHAAARAELAAIEEDRAQLLADLDHRHRRIADALTRIAAAVEHQESELERYAAAGAESILSRFPDLPNHPDRGLGGTLGALMTVQSYCNAALLRQIRHAEETMTEEELLVNVIPFAPGSGRRAAAESGAPSLGPTSDQPSSPTVESLPAFTPPASTPASA